MKKRKSSFTHNRAIGIYTRENAVKVSKVSSVEIFENMKRFAARFLARSRLQPQSQDRKCWCF